LEEKKEDDERAMFYLSLAPVIYCVAEIGA
jgi:hypothetical protein